MLSGELNAPAQTEPMAKPKPEPKPKREPKPKAKPKPEPVAKPKPRVSLPEVDDFWDDDDEFETQTAYGTKRVKRMPNGATITQYLRH
jgi:outer membrane biosynthesis protein TonB